jgi:DNA-binding transcriptional ArsR family regulator
VIPVRLSAADFRQMRFAYSPLAEVAESLHLLSSGRGHHVHQGWLATVGNELSKVDRPLLSALVPPRPVIADFLYAGVSDTNTTIDDQLRLLSETPLADLARDVEEVWPAEPVPDPLRSVLSDSSGGPHRIADALFTYWSVAIEPYWPSMRAALSDDVANRGSDLTKGGVRLMLSGLHESVTVADDTMLLPACATPTPPDEGLSACQLLADASVVLVPSVFIWPRVVFATNTTGPCTLMYAARGVGRLWSQEQRQPTMEDPLAALLGRSRAAILASLSIPMSTKELALKLRQSPPSVSQHLSVLRRNGLLRSWRAGRSVLYRRTELADSIVCASSTGCESDAGA